MLGSHEADFEVVLELGVSQFGRGRLGAVRVRRLQVVAFHYGVYDLDGGGSVRLRCIAGGPRALVVWRRC
jgi:hypothetical protein